MRVLVGDIGGTKTSLALASVTGEGVCLEARRRYPSAEAPTLAAILRRYFEEIRADESAAGEIGITCDGAALAVAGPVHGDRCRTTNLPWELDAAELVRELGLREVRLLNDLEAVAWAVPRLGSGQLATLHEGALPKGEGEGEGIGNACVVAAGTGLGVAGLYWDGACHHPFATEGGHADFAPTDEREYALLRHLQRARDRVSWERVASGRGIANIYAFLLDWHGARTPAWLAEAAAASDLSAAVASAAERGACSICVETMKLFATFYGRVTGNQALSHMALGGVYLGGGVTLRNLELLRQGEFLRAMFDKGRMQPLLRRMSVRAITEPNVALIGAAYYINR